MSRGKERDNGRGKGGRVEVKERDNGRGKGGGGRDEKYTEKNTMQTVFF